MKNRCDYEHDEPLLPPRTPRAPRVHRGYTQNQRTNQVFTLETKKKYSLTNEDLIADSPLSFIAQNCHRFTNQICPSMLRIFLEQIQKVRVG